MKILKTDNLISEPMPLYISVIKEEVFSRGTAHSDYCKAFHSIDNSEEIGITASPSSLKRILGKA